MQGFFVHANDVSPVLTIPQSARLHSSQQFRDPVSTSGSLSLTVHSSNYSDELIVSTNELATVGFDSEYDAYKLFGISTAPQFYSVSDNEMFAVNHQPMVDHKLDVPIGFQAGSPGTHTIVASGMDNFGSDVTISLEDLKEDLLINLSTDTSYTYFASPSDNPNRFILHIDATTVGINIFSKQHENIIYTVNDRIVVENISGNIPEGDFKLFDILGRPVYNETLGASNKQIFDLNLVSGTYIAMICNGTDIQTKKVIIR